MKVEKKYIYVGGAAVVVGGVALYLLTRKKPEAERPPDQETVKPEDLKTQSGECGYTAGGERLVPVDMGGQVVCMTEAQARAYQPFENHYPTSNGLDCSAYPGTVATDLGSGTMRCVPKSTVETFVSEGPSLIIEDAPIATEAVAKPNDGRDCSSYGAYHLEDDGSGNLWCYPDSLRQEPLNPYYATPTRMCPEGYHTEGLDNNVKCVADYSEPQNNMVLDFDVCGNNRTYNESFRRANGIDAPCPYDILSWEVRRGNPVKFAGKTYRNVSELNVDMVRLKESWSVWTYTTSGNCTVKYTQS
jgi:hypothetical protein